MAFFLEVEENKEVKNCRGGGRMTQTLESLDQSAFLTIFNFSSIGKTSQDQPKTIYHLEEQICIIVILLHLRSLLFEIVRSP